MDFSKISLRISSDFEIQTFSANPNVEEKMGSGSYDNINNKTIKRKMSRVPSISGYSDDSFDNLENNIYIENNKVDKNDKKVISRKLSNSLNEIDTRKLPSPKIILK